MTQWTFPRLLSSAMLFIEVGGVIPQSGPNRVSGASLARSVFGADEELVASPPCLPGTASSTITLVVGAMFAFDRHRPSPVAPAVRDLDARGVMHADQG